MKSQDKGGMRIVKAFGYSWNGFVSAWKSEVAFRQDMFVFVLGTILLFFLPVSLIEILFLWGSLAFILFAELVNTAIETVVDRISDDYHLLSKKAKDIGSLLVCLSCIYAALVWGVIVLPIVYKMLS